MKKIFPFISRCVLLLVSASVSAHAEQKTEGAVSAEVWNFDIPVGVSAKSVFEQWRAQVPPGESRKLALDGLSVPARESTAMVRVAGVLTASVAGDYAFTIHAPDMHRFHRPDETELWIHDGRTGEWKLAQCTGNPVKIGGRTRFEAGVPLRFELWTMGRNRTVVDWEVTQFGKIDPATGKATVKLARQAVPASALGPLTDAPDEKHGDAVGPGSPWGDPDGDGLPNWREQLAGTDPLKADTEGRAGLVRWEIWRDIPGRYVFDLRRAGHFPAGPRELRFLDRLEIPTGNGERYGSRVRGLLVAPADGEYRIGIDAYDGAELWLGENESWQSKRLVARADQHVMGGLRFHRRNEKGENVPQDSEKIARVTLKAGNRYYIEILHKQGTGIDYCAVSWIKPGEQKPQRITREQLVSWQPCPTDSDDDGLPDDWQRAAGLLDPSVDESLRHAEADPDGDGASNREEWLAGTDPLDPADFPETGRMLLSEAWTGMPGIRIADLATHPRFPAAPDVTTRIDNLDFGQEGENYGVRLRGYLTAPDDGDYHFSISGNNACVLYLGESEDKFTKRPVARVEVGTGWRAFHNSGGHPQSGPIPLQRGNRYYIEVLFKRGEGEPGQADHSSVAWTRPGHKESVISPKYFSPYRPDPRDLDDDDLPDEWEILHGLDPADPSGKNGAWGDPDGDGLENFREYQLGLDPNIADVHGTPGLAQWEIWENLEGLPDTHREDGSIAIGLWRDLRFPLNATRREWRAELEAPRRQGTHHGARLRARIVAPDTGDYVFSIAGRDVGELHLSTDDSKFNRRRVASFQHGTPFRSWDRHPGQMSAPVRLEAGKAYYIEALYGRGGFHFNDDFFSIAWKLPGSEKFEVIGSKHLVAFFRDPNDQDDDDLPDEWEKRYGLDPADPRGDHGALGDPDRDGLTNLEEYHLGTDPLNRDTDGDGISDYDEVHVYGTNPLVPDGIPPVKIADLPLESVVSAPGKWMIDGEGALVSTSMRGSASFGFHIDLPGLHLVRLVARSTSVGGYAPPVPLVVFVNADEIGTGAAGDRESTQSWISPWLEAGAHTVTIENRNVKFFAGLEISSVELLRFIGEDLDGNGIPDWIESRMRSLSGFGTPTSEAYQSKISPVCVEGVSRMPGAVSLSVDGESHPVLPGIGNGWYADIPLSPSGETLITGTFEGGSLESGLRVVWEPIDPFAADARFEVRTGDAMKFAVTAAGETESEFSLTLDGAEIHAGPAGTEVVVRFDRPGEHLVEVSLSGGGTVKTRQLTVDAAEADFGPPFSIAAGNERNWNLPGVPPQLVLDADPRLLLDDHAALSPAGRRVTARWMPESAGHPMVLARLGEDGPIVASARVNVFRLVDASESGDAHVVDVLADGTRVVEISYLIEGRIPPDFSMWIDFLVTDAVFEDGSTRYRLTAADFDESGIARVKIYKAPGDGPAFVCHWNELYGDDDREADDTEPAEE